MSNINKKEVNYFILAFQKNKGFLISLIICSFLIFIRVLSSDWDELFLGAEVLFEIIISISLSILASIFFYIIFIFRSEQNFLNIFKSFIFSSLTQLDKIHELYEKNEEIFFNKEFLIDSDGQSGIDKIKEKNSFNMEYYLHISNYISAFEFLFEKALKIPITNSDLLEACLAVYEDEFLYLLKDYIIAFNSEKRGIVEYYATIQELNSGRPFIDKMELLATIKYKELFTKAKKDFKLESGIKIESEKLKEQYINFRHKVKIMKQYIE